VDVICPANASALREPDCTILVPMGSACAPHQKLGRCDGERYPRSATVDKRKSRVTERDRLLRNHYPRWLVITRLGIPWPVRVYNFSQWRLTLAVTGIVVIVAFTSSCDGGGCLACERMTRRYIRGRAAPMRGFPNSSEVECGTTMIRNINMCEPQARAKVDE
jgi:hypothetical protein